MITLPDAKSQVSTHVHGGENGITLRVRGLPTHQNRFVSVYGPWRDLRCLGELVRVADGDGEAWCLMGCGQHDGVFATRDDAIAAIAAIENLSIREGDTWCAAYVTPVGGDIQMGHVHWMPNGTIEYRSSAGGCIADSVEAVLAKAWDKFLAHDPLVKQKHAMQEAYPESLELFWS